MTSLKIRPHRNAWLAAWLLGARALAFSQSWAVQTIPTRVADGKPVSLAFAMPASGQGQADTPPVRHVLV
jgi:hypothetical protein